LRSLLPQNFQPIAGLSSRPADLALFVTAKSFIMHLLNAKAQSACQRAGGRAKYEFDQGRNLNWFGEMA
jgi:hypothetical protein